MRAGRELDARIAREVMGLDPLRAGPDDMIFTVDRDWVMPGEYWYYEEGRGYDFVPHYSTDISAAWLVVEKMRALGIRVALIAYLDGSNGCELRNEGMAFITREEAETPALAICLAALKPGGAP